MEHPAITFDFHNTLAHCPEWFELEVRHLPSAFLREWGSRQGRALASNVLNSADASYQLLRRDIMAHGNEMTAEECLASVFADLAIAVPAADVASGVEALMRQALLGASPVPGAIETVRAIRDAGVPLGVVSSAVYHPFLEWTLAAFGVLPAFQTIITSASAGYYKSRPELYLHAAASLASSPSYMVHVGDSLRFDVAGAQRAGLGAVWLRRDGVAADLDIQPDLTLDSLVDAAPRLLAALRARQSSQDAAGA